METIVQITNLSKKELFDNIEIIIDGLLHQYLKKNRNEKLSVKEVADELGVSTITIHTYIKNGTLPAFKIGRRVFIRRVDLDESLKQKKSLKYKR